MALRIAFDLLLITPAESDSNELARILIHCVGLWTGSDARARGWNSSTADATWPCSATKVFGDASWKDFAWALRGIPDARLLL